MRILLKKKKREIAFAILAISLIQMPSATLSPVVAAMADAFPNVSVAVLQTCINFTCLLSVVTSLFSGKLVEKVAKKRLIQFGLLLEMASCAGGTVLHGSIPLVYVWTGLIGVAKGCYVAPASSLLLDYFESEEKNLLSGWQSTFRSGGSVLLSLLGGFLASVSWNLGFLANYINIFVFIAVSLCLPLEAPRFRGEAKKEKLPKRVYYYSAVVFLYMMCYNVHNVNASLLLAERGLGGSSASGIVVAIYMLGGCVTGLFFWRFSKKFREYLFCISFLLLACSYFLLSHFGGMWVLQTATFLGGASISFVLPQCIYCISMCTPPALGATAMAIATSFASNLGVFFSPTVFSVFSIFPTRASTSGKYVTAGVVSLCVGAILGFLTHYNYKNNLPPKE